MRRASNAGRQRSRYVCGTSRALMTMVAVIVLASALALVACGPIPERKPGVTATPVVTLKLDPSPIATVTATPTQEPTPISTVTATPTPEPGPTSTATATPTRDPTPIATVAATPTQEPGPTATATATPLSGPSADALAAIEALSWATDHVSEAELQAISALRDIALADGRLALQMLDLPWISDGITDSEADVLEWFAESFAAHSTETARLVAEFFWFKDGVTGRERESLEKLAAVAEGNPEAAKLIADLDWVRDGVTSMESEALTNLRRLSDRHPQLSIQVLGYPWVLDDITTWERDSLQGIARVAGGDHDLATRIASLSWVSEAEEITSIQGEPLYSLTTHMPSRKLIGELTDFLEGRLTRQKTEMVKTIAYLRFDEPHSLALLEAQPWFSDGLSGEDAAFLTVLGAIHRVSPSLFNDFIRTRYTQSATAELPLAGRVKLWAFQNTPFQPGEDLMEVMEAGVREMEGYMGVPFPSDQVIVVSFVRDPDSHYEIGGGQHGAGHIQVVRADSGEFRPRVLYHELAHFYYNFFPIWLLEGGADFMALVVQHRTGVLSLAERAPAAERRVESNCYADGFNDLNELNESQGFYLSLFPHPCNYAFGEYFLIRLTELLGEHAVSSALRSLYLTIQDRGFPLTGKDIYLAFLESTEPNLVEQYRDLFRTVHGGPWADAVVDVPDDYGDDEVSSTEISIGQLVDGSMDHVFDIDTFTFGAEEGSRYRIVFEEVQDVDVPVNESLDFHMTLRRLDHGGQERLRLVDSRTGFEADWRPRHSGRYLVAIESASGMKGDYRLEIQASTLGGDDHGDGPQDATPIAPGEEVRGVISNGADVDYFAVPVTRGNGYTVEVVNRTLGDSRVRVYQDDGRTHVDSLGGGGGRRGSYMEWAATTSGWNYLMVESPGGRTGSYDLKLTEFIRSVDDHGDDAPDATSVAPGQVVSGTFDSVYDRDFFQFSAVAESAYNIRVTHLTTSPTLRANMYFQDGESLARWGYLEEFFIDSPANRASHFHWVAPFTSKYFLELFSHSERGIGDYRLVVNPAAPDDDDHGNSSLSATKLSIGDVVTGTLDGSDDFDFFRFSAESDRTYLIEATFSEADDLRLSLYAPLSENPLHGITPEFRFIERGMHFFIWAAAISRDYYVTVWSGTGGAGDYELSVSALVQ